MPHRGLRPTTPHPCGELTTSGPSRGRARVGGARIAPPLPPSARRTGTIHQVLLNLEAGTARALNRHANVSLPIPAYSGTRWHGPRALVVEAADSVLPEAAVEDLPLLARAEIAAGLTGSLREQIAATSESDPRLVQLRDELVARLGGSADGIGAITLTDRVYLGRLVQGEVPPVVGAGCVEWYGAWRDYAGPSREMAATMAELAQTWVDQPSQRNELDKAIIDLARRTVDASAYDLISLPV